MAEIDRRKIIVDIDLAGGRKRLENMAIEYTCTKVASGMMNEAEVKIANLGSEDREFLLTAVSPLRRPRQRKSVIIWAGYESEGVSRRFVGDITRATVSQPPDIWLSVKAMTGYFGRGDVISRSAPELSKLSALAGQAAKDLALSLDFQAQDKSIANWIFSGGASGQVDKLALAGKVDVYMDDDRLVVKDKGAALAGKKRVLSEESGLVGIPEVTETGVKVRMLMDQVTAVGTALEIESRLNPAANGRFVVYKTRDNCALRGTQFYIEVEALRPGLGGMVL